MQAVKTRKVLPFHVPEITEDEINAVLEVMREGWVNTGRRVKEFESRFCRYVGCSNAIAVNSGTAALHVAMRILDIGPGDEVITTPYTFTATAQTIIHCGAKPVFADVDEATFNIDPSEIEKRITPKTKAIVPVHVGGYSCDMDAVASIAGKKIKIIEDAAHALPSKYKGRMIGTIGDATCFSFYTTKTLFTVEGGMLALNDESLIERARRVAYHGLSSDAYKRFQIEGSWYYEVTDEGYKYNMPDLLAAIGLAQLKKQDQLRQRRLEIARAYTQAFANVDELIVPADEPEYDSSHHLYLLRIRPERLRAGRNELIEKLKAGGVGVHVHYIPLHLHPYYMSELGVKQGDFPVAEKLYKSVISLPIYPLMTDDDVRFVIDNILTLIQHNRRS